MSRLACVIELQNERSLSGQDNVQLSPNSLNDQYFKKQKTLENYNTKILKLKNRIEECPNLSWGHIHCSNEECLQQLTKHPLKLSCLSNFCNDPECLKNRIRIRNVIFKSFGIRSSKLYNFVIGFKSIPIADLNKKTRLSCHRTVTKILKELQTTYGKFFYFAVRDLNKPHDPQSNAKFLRVHYHVATLPLKDYRDFVLKLKSACEKFSAKSLLPVAPSLSGYKKRRGVFAYLSKRLAGHFGHNRQAEKIFGFSEIMTIEKYFNIFYQTKSFLTNLRPRLQAEFINMLNNIPKICPKCQQLTHKNTFFKPLGEDPPPNNLKCQSCGLNVDANYWDPQRHVCSMCSMNDLNRHEKKFQAWISSSIKLQEVN